MYNASPPTARPLDDYDLVASRRRPATRERLETIRPDVAIAYTAYGRHAHSIKSLAEAVFDQDDRTILRSNYRKLDKNAACSAIRDEILMSTRWGKCPYCRLDDATTLDHILEKEDYPEFSILRMNLAPVCGRCNTLKETNAYLVVNREKLHLYFQGFPFQTYLVSKPLIRSSSVTFEFSLAAPQGVDPLWWDAIEAHFLSLDLAGRFRTRAQAEMQDRREEMLRVRSSRGAQGVEKFLRSQAQSIGANWSEQDWVYALLTGAADDTAFCDWGIHRL